MCKPWWTKGIRARDPLPKLGDPPNKLSDPNPSFTKTILHLFVRPTRTISASSCLDFHPTDPPAQGRAGATKTCKTSCCASTAPILAEGCDSAEQVARATLQLKDAKMQRMPSHVGAAATPQVYLGACVEVSWPQ